MADSQTPPNPAPPLASEAKADSSTSAQTIMGAANQGFIDDVITAISNAEALGKYQVFLTTHPGVDFNFVALYMQSQGYSVTFPDFPPIFYGQPAELFGPDWVTYWSNQLLPAYMRPKNPIRMGFSWAIPSA